LRFNQPSSLMTDQPAVPPLPPGTDADTFRFSSPAEARAFAIVHELHAAGHFTWAEWAAALGDAAHAPAAPGAPAPDWPAQWLAALERLLLAKGVVSGEQLAARRFSFGGAAPARLLRR